MSVTETQSRLHLERMARERRFSARAVPDKPISLTRPRSGLNGYAAAFFKQRGHQWSSVENQKLRTENETLEEKLCRLRECMIVKYAIGEELFIGPIKPRRFTIKEIKKTFCIQADIKQSVIDSKVRTTIVADNRHLCMMLCKELTGKSQPEIGRNFGGKDHTTVLHAIRRMQIVLDAVRPRLPINPTLLQWINETLVVFHALPKGALKGRGIVKHG